MSARYTLWLLLAAFSCANAQNCGLASPAFCETFEAGPAALIDRGRGGELDRRKFSASRYFSSLSTSGNIPFWVRDAEFGLMPGEATSCHPGLPTFLPVTQDTLICEPNASMGSRHLLTATGSQNYGVNAYRIRQPFDFANRTGRLHFDTDLRASILLGYVSVVISDDPAPSPNWDLNGRGPNPRNGLIIVFSDANDAATYSTVDVHEVRNYATIASHTQLLSPKVPTQRGRLHRVQIQLSQQGLIVDVSGPSANGLVFATPVHRATLNFATALPFSRGYVHLLSHNHASWKYSQQDFGTPRPLRSWNSYWDNIGFDGPIISNVREYEIADSNVAHTINDEYFNAAGQIVVVPLTGRTIAYLIPNDPSTLSAPLTFRGVSIAHATRARLVMTGYYQNWNNNLLPSASSRLIYQLNNYPRHERPFSSAEIAMYQNEAGQGGGMNHAIDLPLNELVEGDNSIRFSTRDLASGYSNAVLNVDLQVEFDIGRVFADSFE